MHIRNATLKKVTHNLPRMAFTLTPFFLSTHLRWNCEQFLTRKVLSQPTKFCTLFRHLSANTRAARFVSIYCTKFLTPPPSQRFKIVCSSKDQSHSILKSVTSTKSEYFQQQLKLLEQGFPTFLLRCTPLAFWQMSMYPFSISTGKYVPLQHFDRCTCTPKISYDNTFYHDYSLIYLTISIYNDFWKEYSLI